MDRLFLDLRHACRSLGRTGLFTTAVILTLALTLGAAGTVFGVVESVLLAPLPYRGADRLVAMFASEEHGARPQSPTSPANFLDWRRQSGTLEEMTAAHPWSPTLTGRGTPDQIPALKASPSLFSLLGAEAALGRAFQPAGAGSGHEAAGEERVLVLSHRLWQRRFGGDPAVVGQSLTLDGESYTVVGIMPAGFRFPPFWATEAEMWAPLLFTPEEGNERGKSFLRVFARLRPGASLAEARSEMTAVAARLEAAWPDVNTAKGVTVEPLKEPVVGGARGTLWLLFGGALLVLMVAATNVAGLLLSRGLARQREMAVRSALGASRHRLARQILTESLLLALAGGGAGTLLAVWGVEALKLLGGSFLPRVEEVSFSGTAFAFTLVASLAAGLVCGSVPALRAAGRPLAGGLHGRAGAGGDGQRLRGLLVTAQVALTMMLLVAAGLLGRSFERLGRLDPGFRTRGLLTLTVALASSPHGEPEAQSPFFDQLVERLEGLPGVAGAGVVNHLPIGGDIWASSFTVEGRPSEGDLPPRASFKVLTPGAFDALGADFLAGRDFTSFDRAGGEPVVVVNQALARRYLPAGDAVGARIRLGAGPEPGEEEEPWLTVVGVVEDLRQWRLTDEVRPEIFFPYSQNPAPWWTNASLVVHTEGDPLEWVRAVKAQVWDLDPGVPVTQVRGMEEILADQVQGQRLTAWLAGLFAFLGALLAAVGIFGILSYRVASRRRELGVRVALGARRGSLLALVLTHALVLVGTGAALGLAGAFAASRALAGLLYQLSPTDPMTYVATPLLLLAVALAAAYLPARRALAADPAAVLREE